MNLTAAPLRPDNRPYSSTPFLDRRTSRRVLLAVVISVILHLLLFFIQPPAPVIPEHPRVLHAELQTEIAQRDDRQDRRGDIADTPPAPVKTPAEPPASQTRVQPQATAPAAPETTADVVTTTAESQKILKPQEAPQPQPQTTLRQQEAAAAAQQDATATAQQDTTAATQQDTAAAAQKPTPAAPQQTQNTAARPETETPSSTAAAAPPSSLQTQGEDEMFSDPLERAYYELLVAHLHARLPDHPKGIAGKVRLEIKIQYGSVITGVRILDSSGNPATDDWARKAALSVSPVPPVPDKFAQPYYFRPTLLLTP